MTTRPRLLHLERLEDRDVPAMFGVPWANPGDLTLSFVPDGTPLAGGGTSNLFATMDATMPRDVWQGEILRAFSSWTSVANVNIRVVPDSGDPLGTPGAVQGDTRFGDIRIAAANLSPDAIGTGAPFSWTGSTFAGDLLFNNSYQFTVGGFDSSFDLYTVALQEAGHILGLDNSSDMSSVMYTRYIGARTGLSETDIVDVQGLYGPRTDDFAAQSGSAQVDRIIPFIDFGTNDILNRAQLLSARDQVDNRFDAVYNGKISWLLDQDFYKVKVPKALQNGDIHLVVMVWALERNGLNPAVHLYDDSGKPIPFRVLANDNGVMSVQAAKLLSGKHVYVQVVSRDISDWAHNTGSYQLAVDFRYKPVVAFNELATAKLSSSRPTETASLTVHQGSLMKFSLAARTGNGAAANVTMTILDEHGNVVLALTAKAGRANTTRTLYMAAGNYTIKYSGSGSGLKSGLTYNLSAHILTDNIGPGSTSVSNGQDGDGSGSSGDTPPQGTIGYTYDGDSATTVWTGQYWF